MKGPARPTVIGERGGGQRGGAVVDSGRSVAGNRGNFNNKTFTGGRLEQPQREREPQTNANRTRT